MTKAGIAIYGDIKNDITAPINIMTVHTRHWFLISREMYALSYKACSSLGSELNPETNIAAFSFNIANNAHIIANIIAITPHIQNPSFIIDTSTYSNLYSNCFRCFIKFTNYTIIYQ